MGVGIHGEPGRRRVKLAPRRRHRRRDGRAPSPATSAGSGDALLLVNGFGGTPADGALPHVPRRADAAREARLRASAARWSATTSPRWRWRAARSPSRCSTTRWRNSGTPVHTAALRWGTYAARRNPPPRSGGGGPEGGGGGVRAATWQIATPRSSAAPPPPLRGPPPPLRGGGFAEGSCRQGRRAGCQELAILLVGFLDPLQMRLPLIEVNAGLPGRRPDDRPSTRGPLGKPDGDFVASRRAFDAREPASGLGRIEHPDGGCAATVRRHLDKLVRRDAESFSAVLDVAGQLRAGTA